MNRCLITYELCGTHRYSKAGLRSLSALLKDLSVFPFSLQEQIQKAAELGTKLSIQGVQPKLSLVLHPGQGEFAIVDKGGRFILKPPHLLYESLPENEDLTMKLAHLAGIEVPLHGLLRNIDGTLSYFIKRFDRVGRHTKLAVEDFSQLGKGARETKYDSSMEKVAAMIDTYCTFPMLEKKKLFRRVLFNFLIGNEDAHLKNFSLIRIDDCVSLSPAYDLVNTTIVLQAKEEIALPIRGKKNRLTKADLVDYFGQECLGLTAPVVNQELFELCAAVPAWENLIAISFLPSDLRMRYLELVHRRLGILTK